MKLKLFPILFVLAACDAALEPVIPPALPDESVVIPLVLSCEPLPDEETKSSFHEGALTRVSNAQYYLFRDGALVRQQYFSDAASFAVTLPSATGTYSLYLLANAGAHTIPSSTTEASLGSVVHVDWNQISINEAGFPMSGHIPSFTATSPSHYALKRLVQTLRVRMDTEALQKSQMTFTGLHIRQAARDVYPFASQSRATEVMDGDEASASDIERLNAGETISLYVPENMRGNLLGSGSWAEKLPERLSTGERGLASYVEIRAAMDTPTAHYAENIYRAYLGTGPLNFDVPRGTVFTLDNVFTRDMVVDEGWRMEPDEPQITGSLRFVDTRFLEDNGADKACQDVESFYLMKGFSSVYYIWQSNPDIDFTLSCSDARVSIETARIDEHFTAVLFRTSMDFITGSGHYNSVLSSTSLSSDAVIRVTSTDGLVSDSICCKQLYLPFGISFFYADDGTLKMRMFNPMGLRIRPYLSGVVDGSVTYKPNGTWGSSQTTTVSVPVANDTPSSALGRAVIPDSDGERIDTQRYQDGSLNWSDGFVEYFQEVWNTTGWDSYTAIGGANGYYKHAHPVAMWLSLDLKYSTADPVHLLPDSGVSIPVWYEQQLPLRENGAVIGAGTDWGFNWDGYVFDISTYKPQGESGMVFGNSMVEGSNQVPVHVYVNGQDDRNLIWLPLSGTFYSIGLYAGVDDWK